MSHTRLDSVDLLSTTLLANDKDVDVSNRMSLYEKSVERPTSGSLARLETKLDNLRQGLAKHKESRVTESPSTGGEVLTPLNESDSPLSYAPPVEQPSTSAIATPPPPPQRPPNIHEQPHRDETVSSPPPSPPSPPPREKNTLPPTLEESPTPLEAAVHRREAPPKMVERQSSTLAAELVETRSKLASATQIGLALARENKELKKVASSVVESFQEMQDLKQQQDKGSLSGNRTVRHRGPRD